jgi:hypothetical protein
MAYRSDPELLVLTALRVKSFASADVVASLTDVELSVVEPLLDQVRAADLVKYREGVLTGWLLTPAGRLRGAGLLSAELDAAGVRSTIRHGYEQFLSLNQEMLQVCTSWQLVGGEGSNQINDHADVDYDALVVSRLATVHDKVRPIIGDLAEALDRLAGYQIRLSAALERVQRGAAGGDDWADWFTKPTIDSYHTVWFELHENLLATLGIERSQEAQS